MERIKQIECVDGNEDNSVDDNVDDSDNSGDKHLTYLSQADDCHLTERSNDDGANKDLTHLSQVDGCHLMERSKQIECVDGDKDNGVDN
eukprot:9116906-Ditylum_brightwellii.AAC.1